MNGLLVQLGLEWPCCNFGRGKMSCHVGRVEIVHFFGSFKWFLQ